MIELSGEFSPLQIMYGGKTTASHPCGFKFPVGFSISQNLKHWSNERETLHLISKVIQPYIARKRTELKVPETQKALVIWYIFKGHLMHVFTH